LVIFPFFLPEWFFFFTLNLRRNKQWNLQGQGIWYIACATSI
jgi:hypothetical protein